MAKIFPANEFDLSEETPRGERDLYDALKKLPDDFFVFHSYRYERVSGSHIHFFENDFLILHLLYGCMILEVKGGKIYWKEGLMHQVNTDTGVDTTIKENSDPLSQAEGGFFDIKERIKNEIPELIGKVARTPAVAFPGCSRADASGMPHNYEQIKDLIIFSKDIKNNLYEKLVAIFNHYGAVQNTSMSLEQFNRFQNLIAPYCGLVVTASNVKDDMDRAFFRLTKEQIFLLDYLGEQKYAAIQGAAGTGKTVIALEAAKRLADSGRRVLFLCFNELLCEHFRKDCTHERVDYYNISAFVASLTKGLDIMDAKRRVQALYNIDPARLNYDDVIIDEAQDLQDSEIDYFRDFCNQKKGTFFLFYDKNQIVLGRQIPTWITTSECRLLLKRNCRNTVAIAKTSANVIDAPFVQLPNLIPGSQPSIVFMKEDPKIELSRILKTFMSEKNDYKPNEITILSLRSQEKSFLNGVNSLFGVPISTKGDGASVFFTTAKRFKGLESKVVVIIDIDEDDFIDDQNQRTFYVACSRAMQKLCLMMPGDPESLKKIAVATKSFGLTDEAKILGKTLTKRVDSKTVQPL